MRKFPRSHERGPIEARPHEKKLRGRSRRFPRSHERGPIEAQWLVGGLYRVELFPRSHERGPIEAQWPEICLSVMRKVSALT